MARSSFISITVARQIGSGGSYLARRVASRLGWPYLDRELLRQAAQMLGVDATELAEQDEHVAGFWSRLLATFTLGSPEESYAPPPLRPVTDEQLLELERRVMCEVAHRSHCVVVGHGGFHFLKDHARLLNVFVHAPRALRRQRVARLYRVQHADALLDQADRDREQYIRWATGKTWFDARNYHLSLDTACADFDVAEQWIVTQARRMVREMKAESRGAGETEAEGGEGFHGAGA